MLDINLSEYIAQELFAQPEKRRSPEARGVEINAFAEGVDPIAIEYIVSPTLEHLGFVSVYGKPSERERLFATLHQRNQIVFVSVTWNEEEQLFNPFSHVEHFTIPPANIKYITGSTPGIPAFN